MKLYFFFLLCFIVFCYMRWTWRRPRSLKYYSVDAILPAYNEELLIEQSIRTLIQNPYIAKVICVNDGSTDGTLEVLDRLQQELGYDCFLAVHQENTGKGGALMHGLKYATANQVFLTDADTYVPPDNRLGYMLAEIEGGADAVGGIASPNLSVGATLPPHIRASVKVPMTILKRTLQQMLGGAAFIVSGSCGMFRTEVLRKYGFSDRTKVEDLDLTWQLIKTGHKIRLASRCIVFPQSCKTLAEDWKRYRRWIVGYAVCMRLHKDMLLTRYGLFSILPMFVLVVLGIIGYLTMWFAQSIGVGVHEIPLSLFPLIWVGVTLILGSITASIYKKPILMALAPFAVIYILIAYGVWAIHGVPGLITGKEPKRDKPTRYSYGMGEPHVG